MCHCTEHCRWETVEDRGFTDVRDSFAYVDVPASLVNC